MENNNYKQKIEDLKIDYDNRIIALKDYCDKRVECIEALMIKELN